MKSYLVVLTVFLVACASRQQTVESQTDAAFQECAGIFTPGTQAHFNCVRDTVNTQQPPKPALKKEERTNCTPDGLGGMRCSNR